MIGGGSPLSIFPNGSTNVNALSASSCGNGGRKRGGESHPNAPPDQELSQLLLIGPDPPKSMSGVPTRLVRAGEVVRLGCSRFRRWRLGSDLLSPLLRGSLPIPDPLGIHRDRQVGRPPQRSWRGIQCETQSCWTAVPRRLADAISPLLVRGRAHRGGSRGEYRHDRDDRHTVTGAEWQPSTPHRAYRPVRRASHGNGDTGQHAHRLCPQGVPARLLAHGWRAGWIVGALPLPVG